MAKRRIGLTALALWLCLCLLPAAAFAASTDQAKEFIDTSKTCALTIYYGYDDTAFAGQEVKLYKVAEVSEDFQYSLTSPFSPSQLILNGIRTNGEWNVVRSTLESYILANGIQPTAIATTDAMGNVHFSDLPVGLYFASAVHVTQGSAECCFAPALVALPGLGTDGLWWYETTVAAKPEVLPPVGGDETTELKLLKLWKGDENRSDRPTGIEVEIFRNGQSYEIVTLSAENNWSYSWIVKDDGASWIVAERSAPAGYTATVERKDNTFVLTNTRIPDKPDGPSSPETGDTSNVLFYTVLMFVSGGLLILSGIWEKRQRHDQTN